MNNQISRRLRLDRQSFLGESSDDILDRTKIAVVGLGGGGSHINQQLAHIGVGERVLIDPDIVEDTNLNRLVGATEEDVARKTSKVFVAQRLVHAVNPWGRVISHAEKWQSQLDELKSCDVIFGNLDSITDREQLESLSRRYLIPYIDIGMDVHAVPNGYSIGGQVATSLPNRACLRCMGIVTDPGLAAEARKYGSAGAMPQVIWPNGLLASAAICMFMKLVTPWEKEIKFPILLEYDGDAQTLKPSNKLPYLEDKCCEHFGGVLAIGDPIWVEEARRSSKELTYR